MALPICFITGHLGPADHFATFAEHLSKKATIEIYATGPALKKFQERGRNGLSPSVTKVEELIAVLNDSHKREIAREKILEGLGIDENWLKNLEKLAL